MKETIKFTDGMVCSYMMEGEGKPIVLIHGFGGTKEQAWQNDFDILKKKYKVIAYDLMGHGESRLEPEYALTDSSLADQLHGLLDYLGLGEYTLIAHSLGACVVFQYVLKYGNEMLHKIILADMTPSMNISDDWDLISVGGFGSRTSLEWIQRDYEGYMRAILSAAGSQGLSETEFETYLHEYLSGLQKEPVIKVLESCQADYRPALSEFKVPVAYFYADPGTMLVRPAELAAYYRDHVAAPFTAVPFFCETHSFPQDLPDEFISKAVDFIENFK